MWDYNKESGNHDTGVLPFIRKKRKWLKSICGNNHRKSIKFRKIK